MQLKKFEHGDTIIEVAFAFAVFAAVAIFSVNMMNSGLNNIQRTLETTMARTTIDSQSEALRFIHNNFLAERNFADNTSQFQRIWNELKSISRNPRDIRVGDNVASFDVNDYTSCEGVYNGETGHPSQVKQYKGFVVNPRYIVPDYGNTYRYSGADYQTGILPNIIIGGVDSGELTGRIVPSTLYPRIVYGSNTVDTDNMLKESGIYQRALRAEGVWDLVVYSNERNKDRSEYYDFYIRTCWDAAGMHTPSTITTIVRLYNPEMIE